MRLVIFNEISSGGIADYTHSQANALSALGVDVEVLCSPTFVRGRNINYTALPILRELRLGSLSSKRFIRRVSLGLGLLRNIDILCRHLTKNGGCNVLMHFGEYLAPIWAWRLRRLAKRGIRFCSILHDPIRDYQVGPKWWHELSVAAAFSMLSVVFIHSSEYVDVPDHIRLVTIPHGIYEYPRSVRRREEIRRQLGVSVGQRLVTALGYIRDNKNLDLVIMALSEHKEIVLLIAGQEQGGSNKPVSYYKDIANNYGSADRCIWMNSFLNPEEIADLFHATDLSIMAYSRSFISSSGVLSLTCNYRVPCLVSGGSKITETEIKKYAIGIWVEPDSVDAISAGIQEWLNQGISPDWASYMNEKSWTKNAELVRETIMSPRAGR